MPFLYKLILGVSSLFFPSVATTIPPTPIATSTYFNQENETAFSTATITKPSTNNIVKTKPKVVTFSAKQEVKNTIQTLTPTEQYYKTRGQQIDDRLLSRGLYYIDPSAGFSPDQIKQIQNNADQFYASVLNDIIREMEKNGDVKIENNNLTESSKRKRCNDYYIQKQELENRAKENGISLNGEFGDNLNAILRRSFECN